MVKKCAKELAKYVVKYNDNVDLLEAYEYSYQVGIENLLTIITNIIVAILLKRLPEYIVFMIVFVSVRNYAGGIHLSTFRRCYFFTNITVAIVLITIDLIPVSSSWYMLLHIISIGILTCVISPVDSINKQLEECEKRNIKSKLRLNLLFIISGSMVFALMGVNDILMIVRSTLFCVYIGCVCGQMKNKYDRCTKKSKYVSSMKI